ncbi:MAG: hypothetical protein KAJ03_04100 [Gammaproteobacteria bacterium]|nr:hypothetical protein [Gammaproteobacteria bacterium]
MINKKAREVLEYMKTTDLPQGVGKLCKDGKFCFFGAICDYLKVGYHTVDGVRFYRDGELDSFQLQNSLPGRVRERLRLRRDAVNYIIALNDCERLTFKEIVNMIEADSSFYFN